MRLPAHQFETDVWRPALSSIFRKFRNHSLWMQKVSETVCSRSWLRRLLTQGTWTSEPQHWKSQNIVYDTWGSTV